MANSTCSITSITDLLNKADGNLLNITATIDLCPDICSLAWGKGNPDLLGIGANTSYIFQAILTIFCGPVLGFTYAFRHRLGLANAIEDHLPKLAQTFTDISATFNIPVGIAAAANPLHSLNKFSWYSCFTCRCFLSWRSRASSYWCLWLGELPPSFRYPQTTTFPGIQLKKHLIPPASSMFPLPD